jgi:hypothetical protein
MEFLEWMQDCVGLHMTHNVHVLPGAYGKARRRWRKAA